jgi:hypothetical protein
MTKVEVPGNDHDRKLKRKDYEKELRKLQAELCRLQEWVKYKGLRVIIVFEGRDAAGKGGTIKAISERVSPRVFRVVALPSPSDREKSQMFIQRYLQHFPAAGEIVIFDRSWYNRAGVESVMGFATPEEVRRFLDLCRHHPDQGLAGSRTGGAGTALQSSHRRSGPAMETQSDGSGIIPALVRLFEGPRPHAREDRQQACAVAHRAFRRQAAGAPQLHRAPPVADPAQEGAAREGQAAQAFVQRQV